MGQKTELQKRVLTGMVGGAGILVLLVFGGKLGVSLLATLLSFGMLFEFVGITFELPDLLEKRAVILGSAWLVAFINFWVPREEFTLLLVVFTGLFAYFLFTAPRHSGSAFTQHFKELMFILFGFLYLGFIPLLLPLLRDGAGGVHWVILFLLIVWSGDTGAYFAGKKYGKRKLFPLISPKKTVEGAIGGLAAGYGVTLIYKLLLFRQLGWAAVLFVPGIVGVFAIVGDLCESFLKRAFDKKDSGSILPGHGGFLDRFDGVIFSLPMMYACSRIFG